MKMSEISGRRKINSSAYGSQSIADENILSVTDQPWNTNTLNLVHEEIERIGSKSPWIGDK